MANEKIPKNNSKNNSNFSMHNGNEKLQNDKNIYDDVNVRLILAKDFSPKNPLFFCCKICDYNTCNQKDYKKHLNTEKHERLTLANFLPCKNPKIPKNFICICGNNYKHRSSLSKHKKKCEYILNNKNDVDTKNDKNENQYNENINENINSNNIKNINEENINSNANMSDNSTNYCNYDNNMINHLLNYLIKENNDLKHEMRNILQEQNNYMFEIIKNGTYNINTTNNNSNNKTFNLQFFLNETCKDAMNITDFIDSIKLQLNDLVNVGELGYIEGISHIITRNLIALDVRQRPIHCTDNKRDILYIKDEDKWEKEDENKNKIRSLIKNIAHKNIKLIPQFREKYPSYNNPESKISEQYNKLVKEAMGGNGDNYQDKENKIIKNISKITIIDKNNN